MAVTKLVTTKISGFIEDFTLKAKSLDHTSKGTVNRRLLKFAVRILIHASEAAVLKRGTAKILYMRELRLFAMYVRTEPVHTYIAKCLKRAIYAILYCSKAVVDILSTTTQVESSCQNDNLILDVTRSNPFIQISWPF